MDLLSVDRCIERFIDGYPDSAGHLVDCHGFSEEEACELLLIGYVAHLVGEHGVAVRVAGALLESAAAAAADRAGGDLRGGPRRRARGRCSGRPASVPAR